MVTFLSFLEFLYLYLFILMFVRDAFIHHLFHSFIIHTFILSHVAHTFLAFFISFAFLYLLYVFFCFAYIFFVLRTFKNARIRLVRSIDGSR